MANVIKLLFIIPLAAACVTAGCGKGKSSLVMKEKLNSPDLVWSAELLSDNSGGVFTAGYYELVLKRRGRVVGTVFTAVHGFDSKTKGAPSIVYNWNGARYLTVKVNGYRITSFESEVRDEESNDYVLVETFLSTNRIVERACA